MLNVWPCDVPPHRDCKPGQWWRYSITTPSGKTSMTGYTQGKRDNAMRIAKDALKRAENNESPCKAWDDFRLAEELCVTKSYTNVSISKKHREIMAKSKSVAKVPA
jgi:hypothetical protein